MQTKIYKTEISIRVDFDGDEPSINDIINAANMSINLELDVESGENMPTTDSTIVASEIDWENLHE